MLTINVGGLPCGYSDHTVNEVSLPLLPWGDTVEKHFTLDKLTVELFIQHQ